MLAGYLNFLIATTAVLYRAVYYYRQRHVILALDVVYVPLMKLQIFSDVHLEFGELPLPKTDADVVIAAGDIGVGMQGIEWLKQFDCPVIYVLGNHEFWGQDYTAFIQQVRQASLGSNVQFLENEAVEIDSVRFAGCSLWTNYKQGNATVMAEATHGMNDFRYIHDGSGVLRAETLYRVHLQSVDWLRSVMEARHNGKTVIVTHHAPSMRSWHRDSRDPFKYCYCSDLENLLRAYAIDLWVHGHTHDVKDYVVDDVRVYCNPRGYHNYENISGFDVGRLIEI